jgi:hypothetical protein
MKYSEVLLVKEQILKLVLLPSNASLRVSSAKKVAGVTRNETASTPIAH